MCVKARPTNWGDNLTLIAAVRVDGHVTLGTCRRAMKTAAFEGRVETHLTQRRRRGDIVLLDDLRAHELPRAQRLIESRGTSVQFLRRSSPTT